VVSIPYLLLIIKASVHSVVKNYSNRREHTEITDNPSAHSVVNIPYLLLIIKASVHSVVKNNSNRREHREDTENTEKSSAHSVVKKYVNLMLIEKASASSVVKKRCVLCG
jgi:hypothetical protein